ncbi:MAG: DnaA regulatory inactivator Hda [Gammaproteobacteria bacterium]|nr:DnaA regulatory inactivator Hda [Gammaproteobacteria bacterium]MBU1416798.1 DnaA regulatory inactivator Hda [Gammaproteobacteria bacterium]
MTQLLLDIKPEQPPTLDNFVAGTNTELLSRLRSLAGSRSYEAVYLWGPEGCGKSHLLAATVAAATGHRPAAFFAGADVGADIAAPTRTLLAIDDVQHLGDAAQVALFRIFNAARLAGLTLILAGDEPPARLALREDLRTRIGQAMIYEMKPLSDEEKSAALARHALMRGMKVDASLVRYLLSHGRRDLPSLMAVLDSLDQATLEHQRPATLPLLKEILQLQPESDESRPV